MNEDKTYYYKKLKSISILYEEAKNSLDNQTILSLLETQLPDLKYPREAQNNSIVHLKTTLTPTDFTDILKESCMKLENNDEIHCVQTKLSLENDFDNFQKCFMNLKGNEVTETATKSSVSVIKDQPTGSKSKVKSKSTEIPSFVTAREELAAQNKNPTKNISTSTKKSLGTRNRGGIYRKFVSPLLSGDNSEETIDDEKLSRNNSDENLKNIDQKMIELINSEVMDSGKKIDWDDIAGLQFAKSAIQEAVIWPMLRPDIFTGLRKPPKAILLFGPPGTGKTLIGKCVASQSQSTFFCISASSLTSKWIGDGEKMVRALFAVARSRQPAVIFIDEIDSLLSQRSETEHESSRRIKTEFLVQIDGASTDSDERLLLIGATNRPQELDEAARRRFVKRLYIPLPDYETRLELLKKLMCTENHSLTVEDFENIAKLSDGYSGADIRSLCAEASLGPIRDISVKLIAEIQAEDVRPLMLQDFEKGLLRVKSSVSNNDLVQYEHWDKIFGCGF